MASLRKPLQGVANIVRFNWHFYAAAGLAIIALLSGIWWLPVNLRFYAIVIATLVGGSTLLSLLASAYVYDFSDLYALNFADRDAQDSTTSTMSIVNINAGFDETSELLRRRYPEAELNVLDFYDPALHTEVSIARARSAYPPYPGTLPITTDYLPLPNASVDLLFLTLAAHEIRDDAERIAFFRECRRVLAPNGRIYVTEHLRDAANFSVYNIGFLHFHSPRRWLDTFMAAGLSVQSERKTTPFVSTFTLVADVATT